MAVPKRRHSKTRGKKRRTNWNLKNIPEISTCPQTNQTHQNHRAYSVDGVLYF